MVRHHRESYCKRNKCVGKSPEECEQLKQRITELEGKLNWHKEEKLRLEKEIHAWREREYCDDCSAKTILPEPHGIGCKAKKRIKELEAVLGALHFCRCGCCDDNIKAVEQALKG